MARGAPSISGSPGKSQKEGQEGQGILRQPGGIPMDPSSSFTLPSSRLSWPREEPDGRSGGPGVPKSALGGPSQLLLFTSLVLLAFRLFPGLPVNPSSLLILGTNQKEAKEAQEAKEAKEAKETLASLVFLASSGQRKQDFLGPHWLPVLPLFPWPPLLPLSCFASLGFLGFLVLLCFIGKSWLPCFPSFRFRAHVKVV